MKLRFLKNHKHDFKQISRDIRKHHFFNSFITGKSKDRRFIYFKIPDEKKELVVGMLKNTLDKLEVNYEIVEND